MVPSRTDNNAPYSLCTNPISNKKSHHPIVLSDLLEPTELTAIYI